MVKLPLTPGSTRKDYPLYSGLFRYFPHALAYVSYVSKVANDQHNPGEPLHWAREKSTDHADCLLRHLLNKGEKDDDGVLETGKVAWRALALLEEELEGFREGRSPSELEQRAKARSAETLYDWGGVPAGVTRMARSQFDGRVGQFTSSGLINQLHWFDIEARPS